MQLPETTIIGLGRLGKTLSQALLSHNIPLKSIFNRSEKRAHIVAGDTSIKHASSFPESQQQLGDLIFITVSDRAISQVADKLADLGQELEGKNFIHCSGNESAQLLQPLRKKGGKIASFHPLQTFTEQSGIDSFEDIYFSMQGDRAAFPVLEALARQIGAYVFEVNEEQKSHLHAAAVMASNYLNILLEASVQTASLSGISDAEAKKALLPLVRTTLQNSSDTSFAEALTGPISRGDVLTVEKHLTLLQKYPELLEIYCSLGKKAVTSARSAGDIDSDTAQKIRSMLQ